MTVFLLFTTAGIIAVLVFFFNSNKSRNFYGGGTDADAIILSLNLTGVCIKNEIQAIIQLQVLPEMGKSFVTEAKEMLSAVEYTQLQPGTKIRVKFNSRNFKEIMILRATLPTVFEGRG
ncbi:MAG: hypothetical protein ABIN36_06320 [Ferruginibacter sp.]